MALITNNISGSSSDGSKIGITGSIIISNSPDAQFPALAPDAVFFVSGSETAKSVFGGAAKISGTLATDGNVTLGNSADDTLNVAGEATFSKSVSATENVTAGNNLRSTYSSGDEGGEIFLNKSVTNTTLNTGVTIDVYQDRLRFFEAGGTNRGYYIDVSAGGTGASTNLVGGGGGGGAPTGAQYVTLATNASLTDERVLTAGTGITLTDGGAGSTITAAINNAVVATVSGTTFTGAISAPGITSTAGLTQSGGNVSLAAQTNGTVSIGNDSGTTATAILGGTSVILSGAAGTNYTVGGETGTGTITIGRSTQSNTINIGNANPSGIQTINIGAGTPSGIGRAMVTVGNLGGISSLTLQGGPGGLFLTGSANITSAAASTNTIQGGSGGVSIKTVSGIVSISGSAPGAFFRFNATSTPLAAGDLGMNTTTGRPNAFIGGSVRSLAHTDEIPGTFFNSTTAGSIFTSGSAAFKGNENIDAPADKGTDVFFYVSGSATSNNSSTSKALFGGDVRVSGSLVVGTGSVVITSNDIQLGSTGHIQFGSSASRLALVGSDLTLFDALNPSGKTLSTLSSGGGGGAPTDASYVVLSSNGTLSSERVLTAGSGISITDAGPGGSVTISSTGGGAGGGDSYFSSTTSGAIFTSGSAAFKGNENIDAPSDKGTDVFFYVSGSATANATSTSKALFGGDVRISGSLTVGTGSIRITSNDIQFDSSVKLEQSASSLKFYDGNNTPGISLTNLGGLTLIESKYISGDTQTVTFSNLDGDRDKNYFLYAKRIQGSSTTTFEIRPNGATTNLTSSFHVFANNATHAVGNYSNILGFGNAVTSGSYGILQVFFNGDTLRPKVFKADTTYFVPSAVSPILGYNSTVGRWDSTANLTSLDIRGSVASSFVSGSEFHLYKLARGVV